MTNKLSNRFSVLAPNLKRRLSGVTMSINRLVPVQAKKIDITATGPGLDPKVPHIPLWKVCLLSRKRKGDNSSWRVWHARRNIEMLVGIILKIILRKRFKLLFTSASQRYHTRYTRFLINQMDDIIAITDKSAEYLSRSSHVIPHGINITTFKPTEDKTALRKRFHLPETGFVIGCSGRIRPKKGTGIFVDALIKIMKDHPNIFGVILGRTTIKYESFNKALQAQIQQANLTERFYFLKEIVNTEELVHWYQSLDLYITPSRLEGFGLTPLEAMASGIPTIATRVGAFGELIDNGKTGYLVDIDDTEAIVTAAKHYIENPSALQQASLAARAHVEQNFSIEKEADALIKVYQNMLDT